MGAMLRQSAVGKVPLQRHLVGRNGCIYLIQKFLQSQENSANEINGVLREPCCPPCSSDAETLLRRSTFLWPSVFPSLSNSIRGVGASLRSSGSGPPTAPSTLPLPSPTLGAAFRGSCASPTPPSSSSSKEGRRLAAMLRLDSMDNQ